MGGVPEGHELTGLGRRPGQVDLLWPLEEVGPRAPGLRVGPG